MSNIKNDSSKTILVIITGLLIVFFFTNYSFLLYIILALSFIGWSSTYLSKKIEYLWFKLAELLGLIIPNIILSFIFYFFLFPISILSKIKSKDFLKLRNNSKTVYKDVNKAFSKESFKNTW